MELDIYHDCVTEQRGQTPQAEYKIGNAAMIDGKRQDRSQSAGRGKRFLTFPASFKREGMDSRK
jgi:hypothetical protein